MARNALKTVSCAFLAPFVCLFILCHQSVVVPIPFDSDGWKSNVSLRHYMLRDLLKRKLVLGRTDAQLEQLLGTPDGSPWPSALDGKVMDWTPAATPSGPPGCNSTPAKEYFYKLHYGDLWKNGKYIDLIGFRIVNNRVVGSASALEKYW